MKKFKAILFAVSVIVFFCGLYMVGFRCSFYRGVSMKPTFETPLGIIWGYRPASIEQLRVGDVIAFTSGEGKPLCHRITSIDASNDHIFTWGDNRDYCINGEVSPFKDVCFIVTGHCSI